MSRVLVCDDERHIVRLLQVNLKRQGYDVSVCFDGAACLAMLRSEPFDFLVIDGGLQDPSTDALLAEIERNPDIDVEVKVLGKTG